jgi:hypothetical protein
MFRPVIATFHGKHNECKSKALIILLDRKGKAQGGLTLKQLALASNVSYEYLKSRLGKWHEWQYVRRYITHGRNRPVYSYSIAARGERFVQMRIPTQVLDTYISELNEYNNKRMQRMRERTRQQLTTLRGKV